MAGPIELMNSRLSGSEEALATGAIQKLCRSDPAILIGGLGMGFTLRAALGVLSPRASVTVAELVPAVIGWARGPLCKVFNGCLDDPRVSVHEGDVAGLIVDKPAGWDAILLDVDNGPGGMTRESNDDLYSARGVAAAMVALRPGGVLTVWSATTSTAFTRRLNTAGFIVEEIPVRARGKRGGARHLIWRATKRR